jgi:hypothetical protein
MSFMAPFAVIPFGITALIAQAGVNRLARRLALAIAAASTLLLPLVAAFWINHEMWGYFVSRPAVDRRIADAPQVETITIVDTRTDVRSNSTFSGQPIQEVGYYIQEHPQEGDYYVLEGRVLRALQHRQTLPADPHVIPNGRLGSLYQLLESTGRLEDGEPGYTDAKQLGGIVVEARGRDGRPLLFVGARGRQISNDHYPYYEFLFTSDSPDGPWKLLSFQRFYYDVAGIEGVEWPAFLPVLALLSLIPTVMIEGIFLWRARHWQGPVRHHGS